MTTWPCSPYVGSTRLPADARGIVVAASWCLIKRELEARTSRVIKSLSANRDRHREVAPRLGPKEARRHVDEDRPVPRAGPIDRGHDGDGLAADVAADGRVPGPGILRRSARGSGRGPRLHRPDRR